MFLENESKPLSIELDLKAELSIKLKNKQYFKKRLDENYECLTEYKFIRIM